MAKWVGTPVVACVIVISTLVSDFILYYWYYLALVGDVGGSWSLIVMG